MALVRSGQCIEGTRYPVASDMAQFFVGIVGDVVRNELRGWLQEQMPVLLEQVEHGEGEKLLLTVEHDQRRRRQV